MYKDNYLFYRRITFKNHHIAFGVLRSSLFRIQSTTSLKLIPFQVQVFTSLTHLKHQQAFSWCYPVYHRFASFLSLSFTYFTQSLLFFFLTHRLISPFYVEVELVICLFQDSQFEVCQFFSCILISMIQSVQFAFRKHYSFHTLAFQLFPYFPLLISPMFPSSIVSNLVHVPFA